MVVTIFIFTVTTYIVCIRDIQYSCLAASLAKLMSHCSNNWNVNFQQVTLKFNCAVNVLTDFMSDSSPALQCFSQPLSLTVIVITIPISMLR